MANMIDYVQEHTESIAEDGFNDSDGLVLAELAYLKWEYLLEMSDEELASKGIPYTQQQLTDMVGKGGDGMPLQDLIGYLMMTDYYSSLYQSYQTGGLDDNSRKKDEIALMLAVQSSDRFRSMTISNIYYVSVTQDEADTLENLEQFAAVTFTYQEADGQYNYVSFRGTDGTLEGWCEDFNMAYDTMTEAQRDAVLYLNEIADYLDGDIRLGGHSKGGNDAMYAFLFCDESVRERIIMVYSYDGPGVTQGICYVDENGNVISLDPEIYQQLIERLRAICPNDSIIGQLLDEVDFTFIETDAAILADHDPFTWQLDSTTGEFIYAEQTGFSKYLNEVLDEWVLTLPEEYRKTFMTAVWGWIYSLGVEDFDGLGEYFASDVIEAIGSLVSYIGNLPDEEKSVFISSLCTLVVLFLDNFLEENLPGYETVRNKIQAELEERGIFSAEDLWLYIKEDPIGNTLDLVQSVLMDWDVLVALAEATATVFISTVFVRMAVSVLVSALSLVMPYLEIVAAVIAVLEVTKLAIAFIREHWDELVALVDAAAEFVQETIAEFVEAMKLAISATVNVAVSTLLYTAQETLDTFHLVTDTVKGVLENLGTLATQAVGTAVKLSSPLLYTLVRAVSGATQTPVTVDMTRLQNAVDQMDRLASRVQNIDRRLSSLYGKLCVSNIEQEAGVFTSIANLYNLYSADINVDEGGKIRKKATALSELFDGYSDVERWCLNAIGG